MTLTSIALAAAAGWVIAAAGFGLAIGKGIKRADDQIVSPAPEDDAEWLDDQPHEVDTEALIDAEFIALISSTWRWPFDREEAEQ